MSKSFELFEIEKYIVSRLWYTASAILNAKNENNYLANYAKNEFELLNEKINSTIITFENRDEYEWISNILLFWFDKNNSKKTKEKLDFIQFRYYLKLINNEIPETIEKELSELFEAILSTKQGDIWCTNKIDTKLFKFLESSLYNKPALTCWFLNNLIQIWPISINSVIQDLYSNVLRLIIKKENINEHISTLKCILSKLNVIESVENELLTWLYPDLLLIQDIDQIELALYSRKKCTLLNGWHKFFDDKNLRLVSINSIKTAEKINNVIFFIDDLHNPLFNPKEITLRTIIRGFHWLLDILDMCSLFMNNEEHNKTSKTLSCPILRNIWPSLLLYFLHNLPHILITIEENLYQKSIMICESIKFLVNKCYFIQNEYDEPILENLNTCLNNQLTVVEWILKHKNECINDTIDENLSVKHILSGLENYCTLTVLKKCVDIHECGFKEIENLLKDNEETKEIFKSYRVMQNAIKAILMCEFYNTQAKEIAKNFYTEMESLLNNINSLNLRLEVIENVFSLLFLRHNVHFNVTEATSEEEDYDTALTEKERKTSVHETKELEEHKRCGFICNKYSVKQLLYYLKRCIIQLGIDFGKSRQVTEVTKDLENMENHILIVDNAITDAIWRLELLTNLEFVENKDNKQDSFVSSSDLDKSIDEKHNFSFRLKSKSIFYNQQTESSSDESKCDQKSDLDGSSETGSTDTSNTNKRRKKNKNHSPTTELVSMVIKDTNFKFIINLMLASKESLVLQCLWKSDYARALQVIEMFNMNNSYLDGQVRFSKAMQSFRQEMIQQMNSSDASSYPTENKDVEMWENVRRAAQGGYWNSRIANQLETFVASQESNARLLCSNAIGTREILALCVLDIALTMNQSHQSSINLLDIAIKYLKLSSKLENTQHSNYFENVYRLMRESNIRKSVPSALCNSRIPLKIQDWREKTDFWRKLSEKMQQFQDSQALLDNLDIKINHDNSTILNEQVFYEIITLCGNTQSYLYKILAHLKILLSIIPSDENTKWRNESILLSNSLNFYFGYQIFDLNNTPENLENVANKLGINLVHNILVNSCSKLTYFNSLQSVRSETWGCIILNKNVNNKISTDHKNQDPNQCVADILIDLIEAIKRLYPNSSRISNKDLHNLFNDSTIQEILQKSSELEFLDLSELSVGEHTLAFFLNLWNLMFLHTQLTVWISDPPLNSLRHFISLSSISYHVGDLGRISLASLRSKLLGSMSWESDYFSHTEDLNEVAWQDLDLVHDSRVIFAMINEFYETPNVHIFHPQSLNAELNLALRNYIDYYTIKEFELCDVNKENFKEVPDFVLLPNLVERYEKYEQKNTSNAECNNTTPNHPNQNVFSVADLISKEGKVNYKYKEVVNTYEILLKYEEKTSTKVDVMKRTLINSCNNSSIWVSRTIKSDVLHYLEGHCWLLSYLVKRVHNEKSSMLESGCDNLQRTACFENYSTSSWMLILAASLFNNNTTLATIQENLSLNDLWIYLNTCLKNDQLQDCLEIINALSNRLLIRCTEIQYLKDKLLYQSISKMEDSSNAEKILQYLYQIKDINVLAQTILSNINKWPIHLCQNALFHVLHHTDKYKLPSHCTFKMNEIQHRVSVFYKMLPHYQNEEFNSRAATWYDIIHSTEKNDPVCIIQSLTKENKFELCIEWLEYQVFSLEIRSLVTHDLLLGLLKNEADFKNARKLLSALPIRQSMKICKGVLKKLESIRAMRFIIEYLLEHCELQKKIIYYKTHIGIEILDYLDAKERVYYMHLIKEPLLMLEQLLMNCKLENLRKIIHVIQRSDNFQKADIQIESFDKIVRFYAGKSLDFRVSLLQDGIDSKIKDTTNSGSSLDNENRNSEFVMPINVPSKEQWIPNDKARECNCCKAVIFSMFNRRHHCRRCGRVVCAACSQQRMQVSSYPKSVLVRVCNDCKKQTEHQVQTAQGITSNASSVALECWKLTTDETHNQTVREEFSFEYAPNISLCLTILSLHSDHKAYVSFLLDRCDDMIRLLQPVTGGRVNPEIDHSLIIKMIRSLLVAVKVKCSKLGLNAGLAHCDCFLSQVDLIATLVQSDCLALIPTDDSLDEHALRKLRDLLEKEQWTLALDVSTKFALDTQGVWAAWGKACLKVGFFDRARTKFAHCLEKVLNENLDDWVLVSYPDTDYIGKSNEDSSEIQKQKKFEDVKNDSSNRQPVKNRPIKDPPLLLEILQILENQSQINSEQSQSVLQSKSSTAQEILITLNSLKAISQGQCSFIHNWNSLSIYYKESLYYLLTYGSFNSILEFFVKHEEFNKCVAFISENNIEPEVFFNAVYLRCLNMGNINKLFAALKADDTTLLIWKKYLVYTCHSLDKKKFLHTLYQLQLFMKDFIRAAMTCIRFYKNDARNYIDLLSKSHFLVDAQKHLETELNIENLSKKRRKSIGTSHNNSYTGLTMKMEASEIDKHINTISRQLEIVKFLGNAEKEGRFTTQYLKQLLDMDTENTQFEELPTLFGNQQQKTRLAVLAILCGRDAEEGFGIAFRIMQDYNLRLQKVYSLAGHVLALEKKIGSIEQLIKCCRSSGAPDSQDISDRVLSHCIKLLLQNSQTVANSDFKDRIDSLIRLINDVELKISSYIQGKQLKAAYLLAVKYQRAQDIRKILKEADRLGQNAIRSICTKWLKQTQNSL